MKLRIHIGSDEIGGSCVEIWTNKTRIVIDMGMPIVDIYNRNFNIRDYENLEIKELINKSILPNIKGLYDAPNNIIDGLIISHSHLDHYGLINYVNSEVSFYLGKATHKLIEISSIFSHTNYNIKNYTYFEKSKPFIIGNIKITPYWMDHSAFDSYSFLIESDDKSVFYSGDFRNHGRKSKVFKWFTKNSPKNIDYLLLEGTQIGRNEEKAKTQIYKYKSSKIEEQHKKEEQNQKEIEKQKKLEELKNKENDLINLLTDKLNIDERVNNITKLKNALASWINKVQCPIWIFKIQNKDTNLKTLIDMIHSFIISDNTTIENNLDLLENLKKYSSDLIIDINRIEETFFQWMKNNDIVLTKDKLKEALTHSKKILGDDYSKWEEKNLTINILRWQNKETESQKEKTVKTITVNNNSNQSDKNKINTIKTYIKKMDENYLKQSLLRFIDENPDYIPLLEKYL